jgi:hypothetical protein
MGMNDDDPLVLPTAEELARLNELVEHAGELLSEIKKHYDRYHLQVEVHYSVRSKADGDALAWWIERETNNYFGRKDIVFHIMQKYPTHFQPDEAFIEQVIETYTVTGDPPCSH